MNYTKDGRTKTCLALVEWMKDKYPTKTETLNETSVEYRVNKEFKLLDTKNNKEILNNIWTKKLAERLDINLDNLTKIINTIIVFLEDNLFNNNNIKINNFGDIIINQKTKKISFKKVGIW